MMNKPIFPLERVDAVVAWHNVAGPNATLNAAPPGLAQAVSRHYAPRAADHLPHLGGGAYLLTPEPEGQRAQAAYRGQLAGAVLTPVQSLEALVRDGVRRALHLPYIRLVDQPLPAGVEWVRYGLPPEITRPLKNKAMFQAWLADGDLAAHMINHVVCPIDAIPAQGRAMLRQIEAMYAALGAGARYPLGLMIRGEYTDGNYGSAVAVEEGGHVLVKHDGKTDRVTACTGWAQALEAAQQHVAESTDRRVADRVVMTRLLDMAASPGMCAAVIGGEVHVFPFNGQYIEPGHTACTGTCTFRFAVGQDRAHALMADCGAQSRALLEDILARFLGGHADAYAMLNIDLIVPGPLEAALWERAREDPAAFAYVDPLARCGADYAPRVYDPARVLVSEINPRDTNWTIAMKAVLQAVRRPCTLGNLAGLAEGRDAQILAQDHWPLPPGVGIEAARDRLLALHLRLAREGEGVIIRMPDNPAGIIFYTPQQDPARLAQLSRMAYRAAAGEEGLP